MVGISDQVFLLNEPTKWFLHKFLAILDVIEDGTLENKVPAVDQDLGLAHGPDFFNQSSISHRHIVAGQVWLYAQECGCFVLLTEAFDQLGKVEISYVVAIVGQECLLAINILFYRLEPLTEVGVDAGVNESDRPVVNVRIEYSKILAAIG